MNKPTDQQIDKAKETLARAGYLVDGGALWHIEDIKKQARERGIILSDSDAEYVSEYIRDKHDANIGINWSVIDHAIEATGFTQV